MKCPHCGAKMEQVPFRSIVADRCTQCQGIWLDMLDEEDLKKVAEWLKKTGSSAVSGADAKPIRCPVCNISLNTSILPNDGAIPYETCARCCGVFFSANQRPEEQVEKLIAFVADLKAP